MKSRAVEQETVNKFCKAHGVSYYTESSAKADLNVLNIFKVAVKILYDSYQKFKCEEELFKSSFVTLKSVKLKLDSSDFNKENNDSKIYMDAIKRNNSSKCC